MSSHRHRALGSKLRHRKTAIVRRIFPREVGASFPHQNAKGLVEPIESWRPANGSYCHAYAGLE